MFTADILKIFEDNLLINFDKYLFRFFFTDICKKIFKEKSEIVFDIRSYRRIINMILRILITYDQYDSSILINIINIQFQQNQPLTYLQIKFDTSFDNNCINVQNKWIES